MLSVSSALIVNNMDFKAAKNFILRKLQAELPSGLHYHGIHHTLDVLKAVGEIAQLEQIRSKNLTLLKTAALFHDSGFIKTYQNHEEAGCKITREYLPDFGYSKQEIDIICGMIMATRVPQKPKNHLEEILCDADLLYLGQNDFFQIGNTLFDEFKERGILSDEEEWNRLQVRFLENHSYFTKSAKMLSAKRKRQHLQAVRALLDSHAA
jgi:uncharacterized protein